MCFYHVLLVLIKVCWQLGVVGSFDPLILILGNRRTDTGCRDLAHMSLMDLAPILLSGTPPKRPASPLKEPYVNVKETY